MNKRDLEYYLKALYKGKLRFGEDWLEARKRSKIIIETFGGIITDELFSIQNEIMDKLEWEYR